MQMKKMPSNSWQAFPGWRATGKIRRQVRTLGTHLKNAQQSYSESDKLFEKAHNTLETMLGAVVPELPFENPPTHSRSPRSQHQKGA